MIAPIAVAAIVAGSLVTSGVVVHPQDPVLGNVLIGAGVGTIAGGGIGTIGGATVASVTAGAVTGGVVGGVGGTVVSRYPSRVSYRVYNDRFVAYGPEDRFSITNQGS